jgi:hypothetical protein
MPDGSNPGPIGRPRSGRVRNGDWRPADWAAAKFVRLKRLRGACESDKVFRLDQEHRSGLRAASACAAGGLDVAPPVRAYF